MTATNYLLLARGYLQEIRAKSEISEITSADEEGTVCTCRLSGVHKEGPDELPDIEITEEQALEAASNY